MIKYYTRACNFYYGSQSLQKIKKKLSLPLNGNNYLSFDSIELINRQTKKIIHIKDINKQKNYIRKIILENLKVEEDKDSSALGSIGLKPKIVH